MKIAFIGGGNMGEAILAAMLRKKLVIAKDITVSDVIETRRQYLAQKYAVDVSANNIRQSKEKILLCLRLSRKPCPL